MLSQRGDVVRVGTRVLPAGVEVDGRQPGRAGREDVEVRVIPDEHRLARLPSQPLHHPTTLSLTRLPMRYPAISLVSHIPST